MTGMVENKKQDSSAEKIKTNFNNNKPAWLVGILVILLALVAVASPWNKVGEDEKKVERPVGCEPGFKFDVYTGLPCPAEEDLIDEEVEEADEEFTPAIVPAAPATSTTPARTIGGKFPSLSEALELYKGNTFAVRAGCTIVPADQTVSRGTRIMVHNETTTTRTVVVGTQTLSLRPYYYRTVPLLTEGDVVIKCDGKTAGMITVK